jgi:cardiolipin synthase A/B
MLIDAARRGAQVRIQLDSLFDNTQSLRNNQATADYVHALAAAEGLDIEARVGNPTGGGLHAKLFLVQVGGEHWSAVGSLNGSEISHKMNREVMLMVEHPLVYERLLEVFLHDWALLAN